MGKLDGGKLMYLLYIDPGTGSMLFSIFIGLAAALYFLFRTFLIKMKSFVFGKKKLDRKHSEYVIYNEADHYWQKTKEHSIISPVEHFSVSVKITNFDIEVDRFLNH
jgi:hypothetical protein